jgi:hypothetical protein
MSDQWQVEPSGSGMLGRLLVPQSSTKPAVTAFLAGLAGVAAFVASLVLDWQHITVPLPEDAPSSRQPDAVGLTVGLGDLETLSLVYILGALGLATLLGAVLVRPESALRLRMGAAGLGVGLAGVLVALMLRLKESMFTAQVFGYFGGISTEQQQEMLDGTDVAYEPGMFAAYAAVALLSAAVWLAATPAARAAAKWAAYAAEFPEAARYYSAHYYAGQAHMPAPNGSALPAQPDRLATGVRQPMSPEAPAPTPVDATDSRTAAEPSYRPPVSSTFMRPSATTPEPASPPAPAQPAASTYTPTHSASYATPPTDWSRPGHVDGLSVTASEPIDPNTSTDIWRS